MWEHESCFFFQLLLSSHLKPSTLKSKFSKSHPYWRANKCNEKEKCNAMSVLHYICNWVTLSLDKFYVPRWVLRVCALIICTQFKAIIQVNDSVQRYHFLVGWVLLCILCIHLIKGKYKYWYYKSWYSPWCQLLAKHLKSFLWQWVAKSQQERSFWNRTSL